MTARLCFVFLLLFLAAGRAAALSVPDRQAVETEVSRLDAQRIAAILQGDIKALERLYSDDLVYIHSAGRIDTKKGYLGALAAGNLTYFSIRLRRSAPWEGMPPS